MKTSTHTTVIMKAIDLELKNLLLKDLEQYHAKKENKQVVIKTAA